MQRLPINTHRTRERRTTRKALIHAIVVEIEMIAMTMTKPSTINAESV
jgi:hypothetical protein